MMDKKDFNARQAKLGEVLVRIGVIDAAQLETALKQADNDQKNLGQVLVAMGFATEDQILKAVGMRMGIPYFLTFEGMLEPDAAKLVPEAMARRCLAVPVFKSEDSITVGMVNPVDIEAIDEIARQTGLRVQPVMTTLANLFKSFSEAYGALPAAAAAPAGAAGKDAPSPTEEKGVIEMVELFLQDAQSRGASDVHVEPEEKSVRVRFRVDGMMQEAKTFQKELESSLIARIKIMAKIDITETRLPQDGHMRFQYGGHAVDVRVSTLPTVHGEKVVLRLLDSSKGIKKLAALGLGEKVLASFESAIRAPNGMVLVTGPTGSGKTTTLYAAISALNKPELNIVTLEDPVEYRLEHVNQVEIFARIGLTFATGLRSILRQDPNIILVGEIRDRETAEIAVQAAITGHLVFSTLHTNDAASTIHRLTNMNAEPFLLAAALRGIMAQRLLRTLCAKCRRPHPLTKAERESLGALAAGVEGSMEAVGCSDCFGTGYYGRLAIHEWLPITRAVREHILKGSSTDDFLDAARREGMKTLQESALEHAAAGRTSLEEVFRMTREVAA